MAYDLHIIRTKDWTEAASAPITKQDVDALIAADSELSWSTSHYVDMTDEAGCFDVLLYDYVARRAVLLVVSRPDSVFSPE